MRPEVSRVASPEPLKQMSHIALHEFAQEHLESATTEGSNAGSVRSLSLTLHHGFWLHSTTQSFLALMFSKWIEFSLPDGKELCDGGNFFMSMMS
jgi:hypothetical protein